MNLSKAIPTHLRTVFYQNSNGYVNDYRSNPRPLFSIAYIQKGGGDFYSNGKKHEVRAGDVIFIPRGTTYISYWIGDPRVEFLSCHFSFAPGNPWANRSFEMQKIKGDSEVLAYLSVMEAHRKDPESAWLQLSRFFLLLEWLEPRLRYETRPSIDSRMQTAAEYIHANFEKSFTVEELATHCHMSESHFFALFRKTYGVSPITYKNQIAISYAQQMLEERSELSVEEISDLAGFSSSSYFRRVFREVTGQSPRAYRKNPTV
ncbi:MAG: AraC family transcriptional regulator [Ruminococcaceae bacterium]|nr:AraC family transcriptional regulator [Oscillospiraceae bacterium]